MNWNKIPSLSSLRAFEAAAHHGSFSAAARSLNVTHAAVAQHVRALESYFSTGLMFREGRKMALTDAGQQLASSLQKGFEEIEAGVNQLSAHSNQRPLVVTLTPTFAENWLMPRLGHFWSAHPDIELILKPSVKLVNLRADTVDLAIRYGDGKWAGYSCERLTSAKVKIVASSKLIGKNTSITIAQMQKMHWLLEPLVAEHFLWLERQGLNIEAVSATQFDTNNLVLSALRAGYGLSVQAAALVDRDLQDGSLVSLLESDDLDAGYFLVTQKNQQNTNLTTFIKWLKEQA